MSVTFQAGVNYLTLSNITVAQAPLLGIRLYCLWVGEWLLKAAKAKQISSTTEWSGAPRSFSLSFSTRAIIIILSLVFLGACWFPHRCLRRNYVPNVHAIHRIFSCVVEHVATLAFHHHLAPLPNGLVSSEMKSIANVFGNTSHSLMPCLLIILLVKDRCLAVHSAPPDSSHCPRLRGGAPQVWKWVPAIRGGTWSGQTRWW